MSQERWDVVLRFLSGPLQLKGTVVTRGPVVRIGAKPGPGGLQLQGYRALDDRHAVITCYEGGQVAIAPVGLNQVRVATHAHVDWAELQPIRGPVYLSDLSVIHMGPVERGATFEYVEARRLGVWEKRQIISDAAQVNPELEASEVRELDARRGVPAWFIPATVMMFLFTAAIVLIPNIESWTTGEVPMIGPEMEGEEYVVFVDAEEPIEQHLFDGLKQPFHDFVMGPNARAAGWPELAENDKQWDQRFYEYTTRSVSVHGRYWAFWKRLEAVRDDYAYVTKQMRKNKLPEVLAGVPYQETRYRSEATSYVCAKGWWQFMPETAIRAGMQVSSCSIRGLKQTWTPKDLIPVRGVARNSIYSRNMRCKITSCEVDERTDLQASTRGAAFLLGEAWRDKDFEASGAGVQLTILTHIAGYHDQRFAKPGQKYWNILPKYLKYLESNKLERAPDFYGKNLTCGDLKQKDQKSVDARCGGVLSNHAQHYAYNIVAQHLLAVCYYGKNYGDNAVFSSWRKYSRGGGYCNTHIKVPTSAEVRKRSGK
jgi:hypothetical protein